MKTRQEMYDIKHNKSCGRLMQDYLQMTASNYRDGLRVLIIFLSSVIAYHCGCGEKIESTLIELVNSVNTVIIETPTCRNLPVGESVLTETTDLKSSSAWLYRPAFIEKKNGIFDVVIAKIDKSTDTTGFSSRWHFSGCVSWGYEKLRYLGDWGAESSGTRLLTWLADIRRFCLLLVYWELAIDDYSFWSRIAQRVRVKYQKTFFWHRFAKLSCSFIVWSSVQ